MLVYTPRSRHPPGTDPPGPDTPPDQTPLDQTPPPRSRPPPGSRLQHTVNERPVRILLECILVAGFFYIRNFTLDAIGISEPYIFFQFILCVLDVVVELCCYCYYCCCCCCCFGYHNFKTSRHALYVGVSRGYTDHHQGRAIHMADSRIH